MKVETMHPYNVFQAYLKAEIAIKIKDALYFPTRMEESRQFDLYIIDIQLEVYGFLLLGHCK